MKKNNVHKNKGGFKVPEDYFKSFEDKLSKKLSSEIKNDTMLDNKIDSGFKVPMDYFTSFEENLLQKLNKKEATGKVVSLFTKRNLIYFSGIAAMAAIIISLSVNKDTELNFNDIKIADIHAYINEGNVELSDLEIASLLYEEMSYAETFGEELINDETLLEYLSDEDLDDEIIFVE